LPAEKRQEGWRGVTLVAITYVYFLIFAQFAFLKRLAEIGIAGNYLKMVMGAMAAGGILASLLAPRIVGASAQRRLQIAFPPALSPQRGLAGKLPAVATEFSHRPAPPYTSRRKPSHAVAADMRNHQIRTSGYRHAGA
jgi:hypothetical protein